MKKQICSTPFSFGEGLEMRLKNPISTFHKIKRNSLLAFGFLLLTFSNSLKAQDDPNCGFIVDGILIDSLTSWSIGELKVVFPMKQSWKKFDFVEGTIFFDGKNNSRGEYTRSSKLAKYYFRFKPEDIVECGDSKYAVCTIVKKEAANQKQKLAMGDYCSNCKPGGDYLTQPVDENDKPVKPMMFIELRGHSIVGYTNDGNKIPIYDNLGSNGIFDDKRYDGSVLLSPIHYSGELLYTSKQIPFKHCFCVYDKSAYKKIAKEYSICEQCKIDASKVVQQPGKKFSFQIEEIGTSGEFVLGKVKNASTTSPNNSTTPKTEAKNGNTKADNSKKSAQTTPGLTIYLEKWDNGKVKIQGQKDKDDQLQGTWKYYDETGKLEKTEEWKDNELISTKEN